MARQRRRPPDPPDAEDEAERKLDSFVRGLVAGALVGAVIAGSAIWERHHRRPSHRIAAGPVDASPGRTVV